MRKKHVIQSTGQLLVLKSSVRYEILEHLASSGSQTVGELSGALGKPAESLYYHVHKLVKAGLVVEKEIRPAGKQKEVVYEAVAENIQVDRGERSAGFLSALRETYATALRATQRGLDRALEYEKNLRSGARSSTEVRRRTVRLRNADAEQVRSMLEDLDSYLALHDDPAARNAYAITTVLNRDLPAERKTGAPK